MKDKKLLMKRMRDKRKKEGLVEYRGVFGPDDDETKQQIAAYLRRKGCVWNPRIKKEKS